MDIADDPGLVIVLVVLLGYSLPAVGVYDSFQHFAAVPDDVDLGVGWSHTYSVVLNPSYKFRRKTYIRIVDATGRGRYFRKQARGVIRGAFQERSHVTAEADGFIWHRLNGSRYGFSATGRLSWIDDEKGNRLQLDYGGQDRLYTVTDLANPIFIRFVF